MSNISVTPGLEEKGGLEASPIDGAIGDTVEYVEAVDYFPGTNMLRVTISSKRQECWSQQRWNSMIVHSANSAGTFPMAPAACPDPMPSTTPSPTPSHAPFTAGKNHAEAPPFSPVHGFLPFPYSLLSSGGPLSGTQRPSSTSLQIQQQQVEAEGAALKANVSAKQNDVGHVQMSPADQIQRRRSCEGCRQSKTKCDGELPCARCVYRGTACIYKPSKYSQKRMQLSEEASGSLELAKDGSAQVSGPVAKKSRREHVWLHRAQSAQTLLQDLKLVHALAEADAHTSSLYPTQEAKSECHQADHKRRASTLCDRTSDEIHRTSADDADYDQALQFYLGDEDCSNFKSDPRTISYV